MDGEKPYAESAEHNKEPIGDVLAEVIASLQRQRDSSVIQRTVDGGDPEPITSHATEETPSSVDVSSSGVSVLELAAGTGQHAVYFTGRFPPRDVRLWVPTDLPTALPGMRRWLQDDGASHSALYRAAPVELSFTDPVERWMAVRALAAPCSQYDLVYTANSFHIAPWEAVRTLMQRLPLMIRRGGCFVVYGAFNYHGTFTTESNRRFDAWLKKTYGPASGIRHAEEVQECMVAQGFALLKDVEMPENNRCLCFQRAS